jgi:hypothetical protein
MVALLRRVFEADRGDVAAHIAKFGNDSVNRRYASERQTSDLDAITRMPALDLVLGLAAGKRSDIYSWDLIRSTSEAWECAGITPSAAVAQGHRGVRPERPERAVGFRVAAKPYPCGGFPQ